MYFRAIYIHFIEIDAFRIIVSLSFNEGQENW